MSFDKDCHKDVQKRVASLVLVGCMFVLSGALYAISRTTDGVGLYLVASLCVVPSFMTSLLLLVYVANKFRRVRENAILAALDWDTPGE